MTEADLQAQIDERRTPRARALAELRVPGDLPMTAARVLHYLMPAGSSHAVLAEVARRRDDLGMDPIEAQRSVAADLHNARWTPSGSVDPVDPLVCTHPVADMGNERYGYWTCVTCGLVYDVPADDDGQDEPSEPPGL